MTRISNLFGSAVVLCVLAGCGGTTDDPSASESSGQPQSPLAEYLGESYSAGGRGGMAVRVASGGGESDEERLAQRRRMEDLTAQCMRDAGFEYVPAPPEADPKATFDEAFRLPPDKFAEQYGYGISTLMLGKAEADADDPNTAIRNRLSEQAKKAYDKALNGPGGGDVVIEGDKGKVSGGKPKNMGCRGQAAEQVFGKPTGGDPGQEMRRFDSLFRDLEALRKRIDTDPRVTDAARAWSDCMADARYPGLAKPDDARQKVTDRLTALQGVSPSPSGNARARAVDPKDLDPAQLSALKRYELAIAKADHDCRQKGYTKAYTDVQFALEREFVETHKTMLEQFRDWQAQLKGGR